MTQTKQWTPRIQRVLPIVLEELDDFEAQVKRFRAGEWDPNQFMGFRLRQGVYGQRQPDSQMVRVKAPFGGLTADQLDAFGEFAKLYTPLRKGHVTTRENIQFHHVKLEDAAKGLRVLADAGLSTREACGNTVRNVTGCAMAGVCGDEPFDVTPYAAAYARFFVRHPFTQALPRKLKTAFSGCAKDCAITPIHDVGFLPKVQNGRKGFKMVVGGGTSIMPRVAPTLYEFVPVEEFLKVTEAVIRIFHRTDELRKNRMKARIKFYIDRIGMDEFRKIVEQELKEEWTKEKSFDPTPLLFIEDESTTAPSLTASYHTNGHTSEFQMWAATNVAPQKQKGYFVATAKLPLGDISDKQFHQLADLARKYSGGHVRITHQQNLAFRWVPEKALYELWENLKKVGFGESGAHEITDVVSCPGTDSCKLGITSSMGLGRALSQTILESKFDDPLVKKMHVKMSGCPNGCGQHHIADIGFHGAVMKGGTGQQVPAYELFLGGSYAPNDPRFGLRVKTRVPSKRVPKAFKKVVAYYTANRNEGEEFKDFAVRVGTEPFEELLAEFKDIGDLNKQTIQTYMDWDKTVLYKLERGEGECAV
ncbi:MAG: nitrite/sulfite reductase [SAR202 cluster bacterium]|nr:nitrite/sulfite reductase [SAR202 cluster bacterium]